MPASVSFSIPFIDIYIYIIYIFMKFFPVVCICSRYCIGCVSGVLLVLLNGGNVIKILGFDGLRITSNCLCYVEYFSSPKHII
jgi:hypothetical protein